MSAALTGGYSSLAQACGEAPVPGLSFIPGEDFDPYDEDDVAAVGLAMEKDMAERLHASQDNAAALAETVDVQGEEIARLRAELDAARAAS